MSKGSQIIQFCRILVIMDVNKTSNLNTPIIETF